MWRRVLAPLLVLVALSISQARADIIDNGLREDPIVECAQDGLTVRFRTQKEFEGHVYIKGHYEDAACRRDATLVDSVNLTVPFNSCDVRRQRSSSPRGLYLSVTMIISFHPMFVTKVDRSYNVQCFYTEQEKTVTQSLDVGINPEMLRNIQSDGTHQARRPGTGDQFDVFDGVPEETLTASVALPTCRYEVLADAPGGEPVKFATVGQKVYHQWTCEDVQNVRDSPFCATVHSCNVREESGKNVLLLDENGCSVDRYLLTNLVYTSPLTGGQMSHVFKFADQPSLYFQCQIRLSLKEDGQCWRSSDNCPSTQRGKRSIERRRRSEEPDVDVFSQSMTVFEIDDSVSPSSMRKMGNSTALPETALEPANICMSPLSFGLLLSLLGTVVLVSVITVALLCSRDHRSMKVSLMS